MLKKVTILAVCFSFYANAALATNQIQKSERPSIFSDSEGTLYVRLSKNGSLYPITAIDKNTITYNGSQWKNVDGRIQEKGYISWRWSDAKNTFNAKQAALPTPSLRKVNGKDIGNIALIALSLLVSWRAYKHRSLIAGTDERTEKALASLAWYDRNLVKLMRGLISPFKKTA